MIGDRDSALRRIGTIAGTDVRMRVARGSTVVVLVALCIFAYVLVPDLSTGRALMLVNGHRALYNMIARLADSLSWDEPSWEACLARAAPMLTGGYSRGSR